MHKMNNNHSWRTANEEKNRVKEMNACTPANCSQLTSLFMLIIRSQWMKIQFAKIIVIFEPFISNINSLRIRTESMIGRPKLNFVRNTRKWNRIKIWRLKNIKLSPFKNDDDALIYFFQPAETGRERENQRKRLRKKEKKQCRHAFRLDACSWHSIFVATFRSVYFFVSCYICLSSANACNRRIYRSFSGY